MTGYADPAQHAFWLASRAVGVVAMVLVAASVGLGLALSGRLARQPGAPGRIRVLHEAIALTSLIAIATHGLLLLGDSYLHPGIAGIALPFAMPNQPAWTGIGIIGGWLAAILGLSFYVRRWIGTRTWRTMHRFTLLVYALGIAHTLGSGTDAGSAWLLAILGATALPIVFAATYRFLPAEARASARSLPARSQRPAVGTTPATTTPDPVR